MSPHESAQPGPSQHRLLQIRVPLLPHPQPFVHEEPPSRGQGQHRGLLTPLNSPVRGCHSDAHLQERKLVA